MLTSNTCILILCNLGFIDMMEGDTVKIHLSIDNYEGQLLDYEDEEGEITQPISNFIDNNFSKAKK